MKRLFVLAVLLFAAIAAHAQYNTHFELGLSLGVGNVLSKANHDTALAKQLADEIESMTDFELSFAYYFKTQNSLGLEAFMDLGNGRGSVAVSSGQLINGSMLQGALGLTLNYRWIANKSVVVLGAGIADLVCIETLSYTGERYEWEAEGFGIPLKFKYEYRLNKTIALGASAAAYLGSSNQTAETHNGANRTYDDYTSLARWAITFGPRIHF